MSGTQSARIEVMGISADDVATIEVHAEAIEQATGGTTDVIDTTEGSTNV